MANQTTVFDAALLQKYAKSGPRYTSYPTAVQFHPGFGEDDYRRKVEQSNRVGNPLSLYFHIPFCDTVCFYCGCNKVVTKDRDRAAPYLSQIHRELELQSEIFDQRRVVTQLHWGGGTPTFISHQQMRQLMAKTRSCFQLLDGDEGEFSIEIDPREVEEDTIALLREIGFNRMSLGVQDFDLRVQQAVNRIQPEEQTLATLEAARREGFKSVSIDLIYGLPFQSVASFERTLQRVIEISPDRLSIFNYAHLPQLFKPQRRINEADLPSGEEKLEILRLSIERLTAAGYLFIGMDHFAKPDDELAIAQREKSLYRNFQGYSTHADCDLIGIGSTSIGQVGNSYSQNQKGMDEYAQALATGHLPLLRGVELSDEDLLRRDVITRLICHFYLDMGVIETRYGINFRNHFAGPLQGLAEMEADGLVTLGAAEIEVTPRGKLLIRNICMLFDAYLEQTESGRFSKVI
ncbi:MAG: oxygen-independent coproporphyrinogen III oxidase [Gammaproteobacteria bacterium]|nr:oxygen-independent coproporphyrinogen III oxidase [Gammaproteobacteria bacterium]